MFVGMNIIYTSYLCWCEQKCIRVFNHIMKTKTCFFLHRVISLGINLCMFITVCRLGRGNRVMERVLDLQKETKPRISGTYTHISTYIYIYTSCIHYIDVGDHGGWSNESKIVKNREISRPNYKKPYGYFIKCYESNTLAP